MDPSNPYLSPGPSPYAQPVAAAYAARDPNRLPVYCLVLFIMDLAFSLLRAPLVVMSVVGLYMMARGPADHDMSRMVAQTGLGEVLTGAAIVLCGVPANIALLCKQGWAVVLAWVAVVATLGSIAVGMWQLSFMVQQFPEGSAERIGAIMGGIFTGGFRVALLGLYAAALVVFTMWSASAGARGCEFRS